MSDYTKIEWCDATLNLWWGCTKVSDGCKNCYAEHLADQRYHKGNWGPKGTRKEVKSWRTTLNQISKRAKDEGRRLKVFCSSMADVFEGPETMGGTNSENWITVTTLRDYLLSLIENHPELDFLLLTKRPQNIIPCIRAHESFRREWVDGDEDYRWSWPSNLWIGTSVDDQATADERIPHLLKVPAAVRFLSCEPLLGPVNLPVKTMRELHEEAAGMGIEPTFFAISGINPDERRIDGIHWVICGGESGPNARPMHPDWARSLRDQCADAGVAFFFKQWGEFAPSGYGCGPTPDDLPDSAGFYFHDPHPPGKVWRFGKKAAGRLLNGQEHNAFPEVNQ